jgi:hypothetical protein
MGRSCSAHGEMRNALKILVRDHSEEPGVDGKIILKWSMVATFSIGTYLQLHERCE